MASNGKSPVFVVGSGRSGTTLLYHMILSAGDFAVFRAETHAYDVVGPRYGHLRNERLRKRLTSEWLQTRHFEMSGLRADEFERRVVGECRTTGDFLRVFMGMIAEAQGVGRWSDCTPAHVSQIPRIQREIPNALFIHIIRDGRDVALSAARQNWLKPVPGDRISPRLLAALAWRWSVARGRREGRQVPGQYLEVSFEALVREPERTLQQVSAFIDHPMDYRQIREVGIGSVSEPNTSFRSQSNEPFDPVGRFQKSLTTEELTQIEFLIGDLLDELGYARVGAPIGSAAAPLRLKRALYDAYFSAKLWARVHTPLGQRTSLDTLFIW
jgi:hypothetical protein